MPDNLLSGVVPPAKQTKYGPITAKRMFRGLVTNRSPFNQPGDGANTRYFEKFLPGFDALIDGENTEITVINTLIRRPGMTQYTTATVPEALSFYTFHTLTGTVYVMQDTATNIYSLTPTSGQPIFTKSTGAGQMIFQSVGNTLFMVNGVDAVKWDGNKNLLSDTGITATLSNPYTVAGTGSASGFGGEDSDVINLVVGQTYTISAAIDASHVTSGTPGIGIWHTDLSAYYVQATQAVGTSGTVSATWTATVSQVRILADKNNCTITSGQNLVFSNVQLEYGSVATSYSAPSPGGPITNLGIVAPVSAPSLSFSSGSTNITAGWLYVYCYKNSRTGHVSTASPVSASTGVQSATSVGLAGSGSSDPQVDTVQIYRTTDGGGGQYFLLTEIDNTSSWSYTDTSADSALNEFIEAPLDDANDPPPTGLTNLTYHSGRMWGSVGNTIYYAAGPDTTTGSGLESWPPANYFEFPALVTRLVTTSNGLLVFTVDGTYVIYGNASAVGALEGVGSVFYDESFADTISLLSYNALDVLDSQIFLMTADRQFISINPAAGFVEVGEPIADIIETLDPTKVYVAAHIYGHRDKAVYLSDGSTNIWRCAVSQPPEGNYCWSPKATIVGGCNAIASIETAPGVKRLMVGQPSGTVLYRNLSVFADNGSAYEAYATLGSLVLANAGQLAEVQSITIECVANGNQPTLGILANEISGAFEQLLNSVNDPPELLPSTSLLSSRFYLQQSQDPLVMRHCQIKVDFSSAVVRNELLTLTIYGSLEGE